MNAAADYQSRLALPYAPSVYQSAIFDWVENGRGHAVAEAVAGSGKSTTIITAARLITGPGLFVAFNKTIADMLAAKLKGTAMAASTVHSHGFSLIRRAVKGVKVDGKKYEKMIDGAREATKRYRPSLCGQRLTEREIEAIKESGFPGHECERLINLARLSLLDMDADDFADQLFDLADRHDITWDADLDDVVAMVVRNCMWRGCEDVSTIDFTDMVWLPVVNGWLRGDYSWLFVDECQDVSAAARTLLIGSVRPGGRILWVGDRKQAIYGFAGADAHSFQAIIDECSATVLPLSVCYRCPTAALDVARQWCPQIEARTGAPAGVVRTATRSEYATQAREGDLVLCRRNAPLISLCFELIGEGIPAVVRGRDICAGLAAIVDKAAKGRPFTDFLAGLDAWERKQSDAAKMRIKDRDRLADRLDQIEDQALAVRVILSKSGATSAADLRRAIDDLFSDDRGSVMLSSVHKAKGLEAHRVGILEPGRLMSARARQPWQIEQEENIAYVAWTRAMDEVIEIVPDDERPAPEPTPAAAPEVAAAS